ncbi:hypothetical protein [Micromonospora sp. NPDC093277]|uniref:hypothetical protein n=1 Tax=Micromonospora sp. NPDC093277 TaxID=3364291 RepID=UPI00380B906E
MDEAERDLPVRDWLPRTVGLVAGMLALATAFIAAHVGALHKPTPRAHRRAPGREGSPDRAGQADHRWLTRPARPRVQIITPSPSCPTAGRGYDPGSRTALSFVLA